MASMAAAFIFAWVAAPKQPRTTAEIMIKKLELARQLVSDVVLEDHEAIQQAGEELDYLAEFQSWFVLPTEEYARSSEEFRAAAQAMVKAARREDSKAASDAFSTMLEKCLHCHQYMNTVRDAESRRRAERNE